MAHLLTRVEAEDALTRLCWCGRARDEHEVPCVDVPYPAAMLAFPYLRQSTLGDYWQCHLLARFKMLFERNWHSQPRARGSFFHRWAASLLTQLEVLGQDKLRDEPECERRECQARPNEALGEGDQEYREGDVCPVCGDGVLAGRALEDVAVDMLAEVLSQHDVPDADLLPLPFGEHLHDLEWIVRKFAREQAFGIDRLVAVEERLRAPLTYVNRVGGDRIERMLSGQMDAAFFGRDEHHMIVLDWKDTWAIPGKESISTEGYWQQRFYAWLIFHNYPDVDTVTLREVYVRFGGGDDGTDNHREATITRKRVEAIERQLAIVAESFDKAFQHGEVRPKLWENPSPGGHCNYCPKPTACTIDAEVRIDGSIRDDEHAEVMAGELVVYKRAAKVRELALKSYVAVKSRSARVSKDTGVPRTDDGLQVFNDHRPGLPEGVPVKTAKGRKVFAFVEGKRQSKPTPEQVDEALLARSKGIPITAADLFQTGSSSTFRLVEEAVPTDPSPDERLQHAVDAQRERVESIVGEA